MSTRYELLTLLSGTLSDEELEKANQMLRQLLEQHGARVLKHVVWERRKLTYPILQVRQGVYLLSEFDLEPQRMVELDRLLNLNTTVLRHQILKAHIKTAKELEREAKARERLTVSPEQPKPAEERPAISEQELEKKLAEILTDDMVK